MADRARDARAWRSAQEWYGLAIEMLKTEAPERAGELSVQRGHALKELHCYEDAELCYRDAVAMGADAEDVFQHLVFAAARSGWRERSLPPTFWRSETKQASRQHRVLTRWEARSLIALMLPDTSLSDVAILTWLRRAPTVDRLLAALIDDPGFPIFNARLLQAASRGTTFAP